MYILWERKMILDYRLIDYIHARRYGLDTRISQISQTFFPVWQARDYALVESSINL